MKYDELEAEACKLADLLKDLVESGVAMNLEEIEATIADLKAKLAQMKGGRHNFEPDARIFFT